VLNEELVEDEETDITLRGRLDELEISLENDINSLYDQNTFTHLHRSMTSFSKCSQKLNYWIFFHNIFHMSKRDILSYKSKREKFRTEKIMRR
jgi:hypothetical protein